MKRAKDQSHFSDDGTSLCAEGGTEVVQEMSYGQPDPHATLFSRSGEMRRGRKNHTITNNSSILLL